MILQSWQMILPDFPKIKQKLHQDFIHDMKKQMRKHGVLLSMIKNQRLVPEGEDVTMSNIDGQSSKMEFKETSSTIQLTKEEISNLKYTELLERFNEVSKDMAAQVEKNMFTDLNKTIEKAGNVIDAKGKKLSPDLFLKMLDKVEIDFEDSDINKPNMPTLIVHPNTMEDLKKSDAKVTPKQRAEFMTQRDKIIKKKYEEFISRENDRQLVD